MTDQDTGSAAAAAAAAASDGIALSPSTAATAATTTIARLNIHDVLQKFSKHMERMDALEDRIKYRCISARRRVVQLLDQQYQQQLYGSVDVDVLDSSLYGSNGNSNGNLSSMNNIPSDPTTVKTGTTGTGSMVGAMSLSPFSTTGNTTTAAAAATATTPARRVESLPYTRHTQVRMTIHHSYQPEVTAAGAMAALMQKQVVKETGPVADGGGSGSTAQITTTGTHSAYSSSISTTAGPTNMRMCKPSPPIWTLHIEGKLLIDHLDYQSANRNCILRDFKMKRKRSAHYSRTGIGICTATTANRDVDRIGPLKSTHFFNKVIVTFQTNFVLIDPKMKTTAVGNNNTATPTKGNKKSRRTGNGASSTPMMMSDDHQQNALVDDAQPLNNSNISNNTKGHTGGIDSSNEYKSKQQQVVWKLQQDEINGDEGADMWSFQYTEPKSPDKMKYKVHSIVAVIELYRRYNYCTVTTTPSTSLQQLIDVPAATTNSRYYRIISCQLQKSLFPHHGPTTTDILTGTTMNMNSTTHERIVDQLLSSQHNQVHIPLVLTIQEIIQTFFIYIQNNHLIVLNDDNNNNGDVVRCDTILQQLLNMEQFSFSQLRTFLHQRQLIEPVINNNNGNNNPTGSTNATSSLYDPVRITYIMEQDAASTSLTPQQSTSSIGGKAVKTDTLKQTDNTNLSCLQLDTDLYVPHYLMNRIFDLLQRTKVRDQEYVSCRLKGRLRLLSTLPTYTSNNHNNKDGNTMATTNMTAQARRIAQQAALTARDDDEKHVRRCIDECVIVASKEGNDSNNNMKYSHDSSSKRNTPQPLLKDMVPVIPLTFAQCASVPNSEIQHMYQIDARIEYLLEQMESSHLEPNNNIIIQLVCTLLENITFFRPQSANAT